MNNSYLLKKQLKDNEEELSNYLRDMNIWQDQMKRKEHPLPVKKPDEIKKPKTHLSKTGVNKILSCDYAAWDKFDDNTCTELDVQNEFKKYDNDNSSEKNLSNLLQSKQSEGLYEKQLGNALVKQQKWADAILRYTKAIEYYDKDPVFYANRALCYLKINKFKLAITDCTSSLKLDSTYVKSYQRRSAAYLALGMFNEAKKDLNYVLELEPNNKQAKLDIEIVNDKIKKGTIQMNSDIEFQKPNKINDVLCKSNNSNILCKDVEEPIKSNIPKWPIRPNCKRVTSKPKPPHLRSKKPLCMLKINDIQVDQEELNNMHLLQTTLKEVCEQNTKGFENKGTINSVKKDSVQTENKPEIIVPPPPQTYVQLKQDWAYLQKDSKLLFKYLKQIPGKSLPLIIRNSMDHDLFMDMLKILKLEFIQNGQEITDYLIGISKLPRVQMLVLFCSNDELQCIKELLNHVSEKNVEYLKNSFGI